MVDRPKGRQNTTSRSSKRASVGRSVVPTDVGQNAAQEPQERPIITPRRETEDFGSAQVRAAIAAREAARLPAAIREPMPETQDYGSVADFQVAQVSRTTDDYGPVAGSAEPSPRARAERPPPAPELPGGGPRPVAAHARVPAELLRQAPHVQPVWVDPAKSAWPAAPSGDDSTADDWRDEGSPRRVWWILAAVTAVVVIWRVASC